MDVRIFLEFGERTSTERPVDRAGSLTNLDKPAGHVMPPVVDGVTGRARQFVPGSNHALDAVDLVPGSTLLTRDVTVQAILQWDLAAQAAAADTGSIIARGKGTAAAEYMCFGLELRVVNVAQLAGELRWLWHDVAGVLKTQVGGHFRASTDVIMLTATRRWVSSTEVVLCHYLGDELLSEITSVDGSIGGGTTGTTSVGRRYTGAAYQRPLAGVLEQLRVLPRELSHEEIRATWERLTVHQPRSRQLVRDLHPPGFPITSSPGSRVQRENALWGDTLGYAVGQGENLRKNAYPHRAYGQVLEEWEIATRRPPGPRDSVELRRSRVTARLAQRRGVSIPGIGDALKLLVDTDVDNLEILAFDQTIREDWAAGIREERWMSLVQTGGGDIGIDVGALQILDDGTGSGAVDPPTLWNMILTSIGGHGRGVHVLAKITPTSIGANGQFGLVVGDRVNHNYVVLALEDTAASRRLTAEVWRNGARTATPISTAIGTGANPVWLHLYQVGPTIAGVDPGTADGDFVVGHATVGQSGPYTYQAAFQAPIKMQWAGLVGKREGVTGVQSAHLDDVIIRAPNGDRSYYVFVYRDPALPGRPDLVGGNGALREIKHAWTHAHLITKKSLICDDPACPCDGGPTGGF